LQPACLYNRTTLPCPLPVPNINQAQHPYPSPNIKKNNCPSVTTRDISKHQAQDACKSHLAALQEIKKQCLSKKQECEKECKQAELEEKHQKDVEVAKQALTKQTTKTKTATNFPNDQHDPNINHNLLD
jgi:hypothetical protein